MRVKNQRTWKILFLLCAGLVCLNYLTGIIAYRVYISKLTQTKIIANLIISRQDIKGKITIQPPKNLTITPIDYQIYFYDNRGNTIQIIADSMDGLSKSFSAKTRPSLFEQEWHVEGYTNVKVHWFWISAQISLPVEVISR